MMAFGGGEGRMEEGNTWEWVGAKRVWGRREEADDGRPLLPSLTLSLWCASPNCCSLVPPLALSIFQSSNLPTPTSSSSSLSSHFCNPSQLCPSAYHNCTTFSPSSSLDFTPPIPPSHFKFQYASSNNS